MIELLRTLFMRGFHAARQPVLKAFEFLRRARHLRLRRLTGEAMGKAREDEAPAVERLARRVVKRIGGTIASLARQRDDRLALRKRTHKGAQIALPAL
jgi:hypothetical protein